MKFSTQWLREWVNPGVDAPALAERLTMAGLEVDAVTPVAPPLHNVVVGEVLALVKHPEADKLQIASVAVGQTSPLQIVCGAANVCVGMKAPVALVGAQLPGGITIKRAKLRGVESSGMLCSAKELGIEEGASGLLALPQDAAVGTAVSDLLMLDDTLIEIDFTPNRGDCLSVAGLAREIGALYGVPVNVPTVTPTAPTHTQQVSVLLDAPADCPHYLARVISGVNNRAVTPLWLVERLRRAGIRAINPVVDITNFVLLELGQPMHGFDLQRLQGGIQVRRARPGESLTLLDGKTIELSSDLLVIADEARPLALAGIMGGQATGVAEETTSIILESAFFTPDAIRGKGRRFNLQTDSSYRFERGVNPQLQGLAMERATQWVLAICGGQAGPVVEVVAAEYLPQYAPIVLRRARIARLLGIALPDADIEAILNGLGMSIQADAAGWKVVPAAWRFDITIEADLIEEVARVYGYTRLPSELPTGRLTMQPRSETALAASALRRVMVARGYFEAITYSFIEPRLQMLLVPGQEGLALANPISTEMSMMRSSLWPGLIHALKHNRDRQQTRIRLFEYGQRFVPTAQGWREEWVIAGIAMGAPQPEQWGVAGRANVDFYDVKADVEALLVEARIAPHVAFVAAEHPALHPGQSASLRRDDQHIGWIGSIHPAVSEQLGLDAVVMFEIAVEGLQRGGVPRGKSPSKFPSIRRDLAFVVEQTVGVEQLTTQARNVAGNLLADLHIFDIYSGKGVAAQHKSVALALTLQDIEKTLTDAEVEAVVQRVVQTLKVNFNATLRE